MPVIQRCSSLLALGIPVLTQLYSECSGTLQLSNGATDPNCPTRRRCQQRYLHAQVGRSVGKKWVLQIHGKKLFINRNLRLKSESGAVCFHLENKPFYMVDSWHSLPQAV